MSVSPFDADAEFIAAMKLLDAAIAIDRVEQLRAVERDKAARRIRKTFPPGPECVPVAPAPVKSRGAGREEKKSPGAITRRATEIPNEHENQNKTPGRGQDVSA